MPPKRPPSPRKRPRQERARHTVEAILQAAIQVLLDGGYARMTTTRVAARAGVSVGSLYQYFPSKEAIVHELIERRYQAMQHAMRSAIEDTEGLPLRDRLEEIVHSLVDLKADQAELSVILTEQLPEIGGAGAKVRNAKTVQGWLRDLLERHREELGSTDLALTAFVMVHAVEGVLAAASREGETRLREPRLAAELVAMLEGLLARGSAARLPPRRSAPAAKRAAEG